MFKKDQNDQAPPTQTHVPQAPPGRKQAPPRSGASAVIGSTITVKGDVSGDEDLVVLGNVQGTINLAKHNVTIGPGGKVKADVLGKMVIVEGEVDGDLKAKEQIILRNTARVEGSISAPRVALEDGAVFRGGIEMDSASSMGKGSQPAKTVPASDTSTDGKAEPTAASSSVAPGKSLSA